jgi:hypothetical protein
MIVSHLDVNDVSQPVGLEVGGQVLDTLLLEGACEHVAGAASVTFRVHHFELSPEKRKQTVKHCAFNNLRYEARLCSSIASISQTKLFSIPHVFFQRISTNREEGW